jgi:hypothetical protein
MWIFKDPMLIFAPKINLGYVALHLSGASAPSRAEQSVRPYVGWNLLMIKTHRKCAVMDGRRQPGAPVLRSRSAR